MKCVLTCGVCRTQTTVCPQRGNRCRFAWSIFVLAACAGVVAAVWREHARSYRDV